MEKQAYEPTRFMLPTSRYDKEKADRAVMFIESLRHTKGSYYNKPFKLLDWQERLVRNLFGVVKEDGNRQFKQCITFCAKKNGKTELAAAIALYLLCADHEQRAEIYGAAADRQMAGLVYSVAADMIRLSPALRKRCKILDSRKRIIYTPTNSFYQVLSSDADRAHGVSAHGVIVDEVHFVDSKGDGSAQFVPGSPASSPAAASESIGAPAFSNGVSQPSDFEPLARDDDLPF